MGERRVAVGELEANLSGCLDEVRGGTTLIVTEGGDGVAHLIPEPEALKHVRAALDAAGIAWSGQRLKKRKPPVRLRGAGASAISSGKIASDGAVSVHEGAYSGLLDLNRFAVEPSSSSVAGQDGDSLEGKAP